MALYQPTNVIPSSYTKETIDVNDTMEISWQVNGNSAMIAFQVDFYLNDYASTPVTSTGRLTDSIPTDGFYGTDRFGRPQFFTWSPDKSWSSWSLNKLTNGNEYKYKITQFYSPNINVYFVEATGGIPTPNRYYFTIIINEVTHYVRFNTTKSLSKGTTFYYNIKTAQGWYIENGKKTEIQMDFDSGEPSRFGIGQATNEFSIEQNFFSVFITRTKPTLSIYQTDKDYKNGIILPNIIAVSIGFFQAQYAQEQGDPIRWIRWQIAIVNNGTVGEILADTGDIYTPTLNYEFNGFFNGQQYAIRAIGESESGQECNSNPNADGWIYFTINIQNQGEYSGDLTVQCLNKENATLLEWEGVEVIPPTVNPQGYEPTISNGSVTLNGKNGDTEYSVTWDKRGANPMNFAAPWTAVWKGKIGLEYDSEVIQISGLTNNQKEIDGKTYWYYEETKATHSDINKILLIDVRMYGGNGFSQTSVKTVGNENYITITLLSQYEDVLLSADTWIYWGEPVFPKGKIFSVLANAGEMITVNQNSDSSANHFTVTVNGNDNIIPIKNMPTEVAFTVSPGGISVRFYAGGNIINQQTIPISYTQQPITSVSIYGGDSGATIDSVSVYQGDGSNILSLYENPDFEPVWNSPDYNLYMTANFNGNLEGGTGTSAGTGFRIYRQEIGKNVLKPIATVSSTTTSLKDYGIVSRKAYKYSLYAYDNNGAFMSVVENEKVVATCFKNYSLLVCDYDEVNDEYHVRKQYLFALNPTESGVGNNNSPTLNANFTRYPTRMPSTQNYASGTLQGLIGAIYTVPALIEQIGNYKWTTKPSTMDYFDNVDLEKELYDLSTAPYQLFLRDMKGRLRMIHTSAPITMTTNIKQKQQSISMSLPWVEIGDASDVTIIQTPDDYGWNNDNQVLDVKLDVDIATGELSATYPFPYNGTKFFLTGVNKETLTAKTPLGITPAQFELSETTTQPNDGEVTATVNVNTENN